MPNSERAPAALATRVSELLRAVEMGLPGTELAESAESMVREQMAEARAAIDALDGAQLARCERELKLILSSLLGSGVRPALSSEMPHVGEGTRPRRPRPARSRPPAATQEGPAPRWGWFLLGAGVAALVVLWRALAG